MNTLATFFPLILIFLITFSAPLFHGVHAGVRAIRAIPGLRRGAERS